MSAAPRFHPTEDTLLAFTPHFGRFSSLSPQIGLPTFSLGKRVALSLISTGVTTTLALETSHSHGGFFGTPRPYRPLFGGPPPGFSPNFS